jgi:predicted AAA+ superfamily ATPase
VIFVDEVQYLKNPSNFLKLLYDEYNENLKLVVSGSSSFYIDQKFKDSLM